MLDEIRKLLGKDWTDTLDLIHRGPLLHQSRGNVSLTLASFLLLNSILKHLLITEALCPACICQN